MDEPAPKTYWAPALLLILGGGSCLAVFLVGMSGVFGYLQDPGSVGVSGLALSIMCCALFLWMIPLLIGNSRLVVTSAGISVWRSAKMRRQVISWDSIKSFEIGRASRRSSMPAVVVVLESERLPLKATTRFTSRVETIRKELEDARARYTADGIPPSNRDIAGRDR